MADEALTVADSADTNTPDVMAEENRGSRRERTELLVKPSGELSDPERQVEDLRKQLTEQERDHGGKLAAERKEREMIEDEHAARVARLEAAGESQRLKVQDLLAQVARLKEEHRAALAEKEGAVREAEAQGRLLQQAIEGLKGNFSAQEQDYQRKLAALAETEGKAREKLSREHAGRVAELEARGETQRLLLLELQAQIAGLREERRGVVDRANPGLIEPKESDDRHQISRRSPESDQGVKSVRAKDEEDQPIHLRGFRPRPAVMLTSYVLTLGLGYLLSLAVTKPGTLSTPAQRNVPSAAVTAGSLVAAAPSHPTPEPVAIASPEGQANPATVTTVDPKPEVGTVGDFAIPRRPLWLAWEEPGFGLVDEDTSANALRLIGSIASQADKTLRGDSFPIANASNASLGGDSDKIASSESVASDEEVSGIADSKTTLEEAASNSLAEAPAKTDRSPTDSETKFETVSPAMPPELEKGILQNVAVTASEVHPVEKPKDVEALPAATTDDGTSPGLGDQSNPNIEAGKDNGELASLNRQPGTEQAKAATKKADAHGSPTPAAAPMKVLILGDSMSLCGFGKRLDDKIRTLPQVNQTFTYMASGTNPLSWLKEKPFGTVKTRSGFWSIESVAGKDKPKSLQDTYGMRRGSSPKAHLVPKLEDMLTDLRPDVLIVQNGNNLFGLFRDGKTLQPKQHAALLKHYLEPFIAKALAPSSPLRKIYWVASPTSGRVSKEIQDFVIHQIRDCAGEMFSVIDSRELISYPYRHMSPDREHFEGADMDQWADKVFDIIARDLSSASLSELKPLGDFPVVAAEETKPANVNAAQTELYVKATLSFKSEPLQLKELLPYQESLVGYVYDVQEVIEGQYDDRRVLVMHPAHIGLKSQPLKSYQVGKTYKLHLRELEGTMWSTVKAKDDSGAIELTPYIQVEDDNRNPGRDHGASINNH